MTQRRSAGAALWPVGLLVGGTLLLAVGAAPASAAPAGTITSPQAGTTYTTNQTVQIAASASGVGDGSLTLTLADPAKALPGSRPRCTYQLAAAQTSASDANGDTVSGQLDLAAAYASSSCDPTTAGHPASNGTWTVTLAGTGGDAGTSDTRTFTVTVPPAAPTGVKADPATTGHETVTWTQNAELDTVAYDVVDANGTALSGGAEKPAGTLCSGGSCSATVTVPAGDGHTAAVRAYRQRNPDGTGTDLTAVSQPVPLNGTSTSPSASPSAAESPSAAASSPGSAQPSPDASPSPTRSQAAPTSGAPAARPTPSAKLTRRPLQLGNPKPATPRAHSTLSAAQQSQNAAILASDGKAPGVGSLPGKLFPRATPTASGTGQPVAAGGAPQAEGVDGPYSTKLGYADPLTQSQQDAAADSAVPLSTLAADLGLTPQEFWQSIAFGAVLLIAAAHARAFATREIV